MLICVFRANSAPRSSSDKAELNEEGFDDVLYRACLFARCGGKSFKSHGASAEFVYNGFENGAVGDVESELVYVHKCKSLLSDGKIDSVEFLVLGKVANTAQKSVCDTRSAS